MGNKIITVHCRFVCSGVSRHDILHDIVSLVTVARTVDSSLPNALTRRHDFDCNAQQQSTEMRPWLFT